MTQQLREFFVRQHPRLRPQDLHDDDLLLEKGLIDSSSMLDLISFLETKFGIVVSEEEMIPDHFESLNAITQFVAQKQPA